MMMRRLDAKDVPIEVSVTGVVMGVKNIHIVIADTSASAKKRSSNCSNFEDIKLVREAGVEPTTFGSGGRRSIQLSYSRIVS